MSAPCLSDVTYDQWLDLAGGLIARSDAMAIVCSNGSPVPDASWLVLHGDERISLGWLDKITAMMHEREAGMPLAYVLGYKDFYGRKFELGKPGQVLIPRPETEDIIDIVRGIRPKSIADIGTGSGCIAVTLALEIPGATIIATDISSEALDVARNNARHYGVEARIRFVKTDLMDGVSGVPDVVVANLPYVDKDWDWLDQASLSFEPCVALYADDGGLILIKKLIDTAARLRVPHLVLEADLSQHQRIINYAKSYRVAERRNYILHLILDTE